MTVWYPQFPKSKNKKFIFGQKRNGSIVVFEATKKYNENAKKKNGPFFQLIVPRIPMFDGGAPLGISPSQPWPDFASDLRPPDHPGERVISNLKRFAGGKICCFSMF